MPIGRRPGPDDLERLRQHIGVHHEDGALSSRPVGQRHGLGRGGRLVQQGGAGNRQSPVRSSTTVWKLIKASSRPWLISG